jgi:hypothetical protein
MTQDEIMFMAMKSGCPKENALANMDILEVFAKLVAAKERDRMCKQCNWSKHENATCNEANQPEILGKS